MSAGERVLAGPVPIAYRLVRARRRSIGVEIARGSVVVRAPRWVGIGEIHDFLHEKAHWIRDRLDEWWSARAAIRPDQWCNGAPVRYRGEDKALVIARGPVSVATDLFDLRVSVPAITPELVRETVEGWLRAQALQLFEDGVARCARSLGLAVPKVRLSNARTQWGSCERGGPVRLHWRLIQLAPELAQYVIAHEVAHLVHMDHSPRFWSVVSRLFAEHHRARAELSKLSPLIDD